MSTAKQLSTMTISSVAQQASAQPGPSTASHRVVWGDNLTRIARRYGTTIPRLVELNPWLSERRDYVIYDRRDTIVVPAPDHRSEPSGAVQLDKNGDPILRVGQSHPAVVELRRLLREAGYPSEPEGDEATVDGALFSAISDFQSTSSFYNGASVEGVAGPAVWAALRHEAAERVAYDRESDPVRPATAPQLREPQAVVLDVLGSAPAPNDHAPVTAAEHAVSDTPAPPLVFDAPRRVIQFGRVGEDARMVQRMLNRAGYRLDVDARFFGAGQRAVEQFQRDNDLSVDGKVFNESWPALFEASLEPSTTGRVQFDLDVDELTSVEQRVAFDVFQNLAYDDPARMDDLMRLVGAGRDASRREVRLTREHIERLAGLARTRGLPLNSANAEVLRHLGAGVDTGRLNYHGASMVHLFLTQAPPPDNRTYNGIIAEAASTREPTPSLVRAVTYRESGFNPTIGSRAGAVGLMQLMPATARELGVTDRTDPRQNVRGGTEFLDRLHGRFGNWFEALAAYNGGPTRMANRELLEMPLESVNYVNYVTLSYLYYANLVGEDPRFLIGE
ncbi:MAG: transglycosylase SLT domain-containing protein [Myxococcota bacterium]